MDDASDISPLFDSWDVTKEQRQAIDMIRQGFSGLLHICECNVHPDNARYMALVKTHLEYACMFAIKGVSRPPTEEV